MSNRDAQEHTHPPYNPSVPYTPSPNDQTVNYKNILSDMELQSFLAGKEQEEKSLSSAITEATAREEFVHPLSPMDMQDIPLMETTHQDHENDDDDKDYHSDKEGEEEEEEEETKKTRSGRRHRRRRMVVMDVHQHGGNGNEGERDNGNNDNDDDDEERDEEERDYDEHESLLRVESKLSESLMINIPNLDDFFKLVYQYFEEKGFWCILTNRLLRLVTVLFIIVFSGFLLLLIDWIALWKCVGAECKNTVVVFIPQSLDDMGLYRWTVVTIESVFLCFWLGLSFLSVYQVASMVKIKHFYNQHLNVSEKEVQSITWSELVEKIVEIQKKRPGSISRIKTLDEWDIANLIMRKDNYLIAFINKDILNLRIPLPFIGHEQILSKSLLYNLRYVISLMFDSDYNVRDEFIRNPNELRWKFIYLGVLNLLASPFVFIFLVVYLLFFYAAEIRINGFGSIFMERRWSTYALYRFKEFNELNHIFEARMKCSIGPAKDYVRQFPDHLLSNFAQTVMFFCSACIAVIAALTFVKSDLLLFTNIFSQNLVWWLSILLLVFGNAKTFVIEENQIFDPNQYFDQIAKETHYVPPHWQRKGHHIQVRKEFTQLFQPNIILVLKELSSIVITPLILCFSLANSAENFCNFVDEITTEMDAIGHVCGFATFDTTAYGDERYGSEEPSLTSESPMSAQFLEEGKGVTMRQSPPSPAPLDSQLRQHHGRERHIKSQYGKMEKSLLNFMSSHPKWQPQESLGASRLVQRLTTSAIRQALTQQQNRQEQMGEFGKLVQSMSPHSSMMMTSTMKNSDPQLEQQQQQQQREDHELGLSSNVIQSQTQQQMDQSSFGPISAELGNARNIELKSVEKVPHNSRLSMDNDIDIQTEEEQQVRRSAEHDRVLQSQANIDESMLQSSDFLHLVESYYQARTKK